MRVERWGNSLAVRFPAALVEALELKEGDEIELNINRVSSSGIEQRHSRGIALDRIRALRRPLPEDWKFDRDEANGR